MHSVQYELLEVAGAAEVEMRKMVVTWALGQGHVNMVTWAMGHGHVNTV